jgi:peptidoglycan/xylan/chitin deacetylase (PgdA/CDA1 family)
MFAVLISAAAAAALILLWCAYRYALFLPARQGLPVLLYHKVSEGHNDALTISRDRLERQFAHLVAAGYRGISFADLKESLAGGRPLPAKPVLLTFDDGYLNAFILAYPLLVKYNLKATFLLPTAFLGGFDAWNAVTGAVERLMSYPTARSMAGPLVEFGLHSHRHENYRLYSAEEIEADVAACVASLEQNQTPFTRVFAYPYGGVPRVP